MDEAQDLTASQVKLILAQPCRVIMIGDPHQEIYQFRGTQAGLSLPDEVTGTRHQDNTWRLPADTPTKWLSQSFRFGCHIAEVANAVLSLKQERKRVLGLPEVADSCESSRQLIPALGTAASSPPAVASYPSPECQAASSSCSSAAASAALVSPVGVEPAPAAHSLPAPVLCSAAFEWDPPYTCIARSNIGVFKAALREALRGRHFAVSLASF